MPTAAKTRRTRGPRFLVEIEFGEAQPYDTWSEAVTDLIDMGCAPDRATEWTEDGPKDVTQDLIDAVVAVIPDEFAA